MQQQGYPPHPPHGHAHGEQPQGPQYGQPPPGYAPQAGYGAPPPGAYPAQHLDPRVKDLNDQSNTWLIVAIAGFWLGFGFITGPLAWVKGSRLRANYRSMGMAPSGSATGAWIIGIVSTGMIALAILAVVGAIAMFGLAVASAGV